MSAAGWLRRVRKAARDGPEVLSMTMKFMTRLFFCTRYKELQCLSISFSSGQGGFKAPEPT